MNIQDYRPKIGLIVSTLMKDEYNDFTNTRPAALEKLEILKKILGRLGDVVSPGLLESISDGKSADRVFRNKEVDLIVYTALSYNKGAAAKEAVLNNSIPLVIWNTQALISLPGESNFDDMWTNSGFAGIPELCNTLIRSARPFEFITSHMESPDALKKIQDFLDLVLLKNCLADLKVAMVGQIYSGMTDFMIDNLSLSRALGPSVFPVAPYLVAEEIERVDRKAVESLVDDTRKRYNVNVGDELMKHSAALALAMEKVICGDYRANAVAMLDQVWMKEPRIGIPPTFAYLYLNRKGFPCVNEVDVASTVAVTILQLMAGKSAVVEFFDMDFEKGTVVLCHDTNGNPAMAAADTDVFLTEAPLYSGVRGSGAACEFLYPEGAVTLLSIASLPSGWRLVVTEGESVKIPYRSIGAPFFSFRPDSGSFEQFCESWCRAGATHHMGFAYGRYKERIKFFAGFMGLKAVLV